MSSEIATGDEFGDEFGAALALAAALADTAVEVAAAWYCELNCFKWPAGFPLPKPADWDTLRDRDKHAHPLQRLAIDAVSHVVPRKEQSRAWHTGGYCGKKKTEREFEAWWKESERRKFGLGDPGSPE